MNGNWDNLILLGGCLILGRALRAIRRLPDSTPAVLNAVVMNICLPALTLVELHRLPLEPWVIFPAAMAWLIYLAGAPILLALAWRLRLDRASTGALILTACLGNTSFVGFPLLQALYGPRALETGILADQPGTFLVFSSLGLITASACSPLRGKGRWLEKVREIGKRVLTFPPMLALLAALALRPWAFPSGVEGALEKLAAPLIPLALLSLSFLFDPSSLSWRSRTPAENRAIAGGLAYKLVLAPALILLLYAGGFGLQGHALRITVVEAAMAPMILASLLAIEQGLNPRIASGMLGIGIPLSFATVAAWAWVLRGF